MKSRIFRFISPVFRLRENGEPDKLINIALVNQPAITGMKPIINQSNEEILTMEITRDELTELIKSTVAAMNSAPTTEVKTEEKSTEEETKEVETTEVENTCSEEETKNEEPETTEGETKEETTEEDGETKEETEEKTVEEIKEEPEVIREDVLNQAPTTNIPSPDPEWKSLSGKKFIEWCEKHPELCR